MKSAWISIKDKQPPKMTEVLFHVIERGNISSIKSGRLVKPEIIIVGGYFSWDIGEITHWRPINLDRPEEYKNMKSE